MRVLAIDPGTNESGLVVLDAKIQLHRIVPNEAVLKIDPSNFLTGIDAVAIEMTACYGMPVGDEVLETTVWIGRFMHHFQSAGYQVVRYKRMLVKMHLCQNSRASDSNIRQALIDRLGPPGKAKAPGPTYGVVSHEWQALALAVYAKDKLHYTLQK